MVVEGSRDSHDVMYAMESCLWVEMSCDMVRAHPSRVYKHLLFLAFSPHPFILYVLNVVSIYIYIIYIMYLKGWLEPVQTSFNWFLYIINPCNRN